MSSHDTFTDGDRQEQLKVGVCECEHYRVGSFVPEVEDGVYIGGYAIVIRHGRLEAIHLISEFGEINIPNDNLRDKWGDKILLSEFMRKGTQIISERNPVRRALALAEV